jgi:hypothetical protein
VSGEQAPTPFDVFAAVVEQALEQVFDCHELRFASRDFAGKRFPSRD